jgi:hypothetical protein
MLDEVDLEIAGRYGGVLEPGKDGDGPVEEADGFGSRGSAEFHVLSGLVQEPVDGAGTDCCEFVGDRIGHTVVLSEPDKVKVQPEEGGEELSAGPVEVFPQHFEHSGDCGVIAGLVDPFFPAFFNDEDFHGLAVKGSKMRFSDTVQLEDGVFAAFTA